jgi:hypothetical protein
MGLEPISKSAVHYLSKKVSKIRVAGSLGVGGV